MCEVSDIFDFKNAGDYMDGGTGSWGSDNSKREDYKKRNPSPGIMSIIVNNMEGVIDVMPTFRIHTDGFYIIKLAGRDYANKRHNILTIRFSKMWEWKSWIKFIKVNNYEEQRSWFIIITIVGVVL